MFCLHLRVPRLCLVSTKVKGSGRSGTEVRLVVNCHVDAENRTRALCESNKCSKPRNRLSIPKMFSFVNSTQSRITREEDLREGLARSGWPVAVPVGACHAHVDWRGETQSTVGITIPQTPVLQYYEWRK